MKDFFTLFRNVIWFIAKITSAIAAAFYTFTDDISKATFYVALICLFLLIDLDDDLTLNK